MIIDFINKKIAICLSNLATAEFILKSETGLAAAKLFLGGIAAS